MLICKSMICGLLAIPKGEERQSKYHSERSRKGRKALRIPKEDACMFVILALMYDVYCARFRIRTAYCFCFDGVIVHPWGYIGIVQSTVPGLAHSIGLVHFSSPSAVNGDVKEVKVVVTSNGEPIVDLVVVGCDKVRHCNRVVVLAQMSNLNSILS